MAIATPPEIHPTAQISRSQVEESAVLLWAVRKDHEIGERHLLRCYQANGVSDIRRDDVTCLEQRVGGIYQMTGGVTQRLQTRLYGQLDRWPQLCHHFLLTWRPTPDLAL